MNIKTITCHNVYNYGASLQAYALMKYLQNLGHNVEIIDYMPKYIRDSLSLWSIGKRWNKNMIIKFAFYCYVVPMRICNKRGHRKFDAFTNDYLSLTKRYNSYEELCEYPPEADVYFAGSDQIWNPTINNGLDPAFYLNFISECKTKASYAASFSISDIPVQYQNFIKEKLTKLDFISVREESGLRILQKLGFNKGVQVVDPVFLLEKNDWEKFIYRPKYEQYILVYDQENNGVIKDLAVFFSQCKKKKIVAFRDLYPRFYADYTETNTGPIDFLSLIAHADIVITNSFHCMAFSIIFEKNFYVVPRMHQKVNSRMKDLLDFIGCSDRLIAQTDFQYIDSIINYEYVKNRLLEKKKQSCHYINTVLTLSK